MKAIWTFIQTYLEGVYFPDIKWADVLDILIIAYILYHLFLWIKTSRAMTLLRGILVVAVFLAFASIAKLNTILWIAKNLINVILLALVILFQPELRRALDELGRKNFFSKFFRSMNLKNNEEKNLSDKTIYELVKTAVQLSKDKTGALIVVEHDTPLGEYINTGISIDAVVTQQLLINIFEKNTPLHDGAVIIKDNRVVAATCYLPLTDNGSLEKNLGTRHRAGLGISEVTDSMTIIVSEETGEVSIAYRGQLYKALDEDGIRRKLSMIQRIRDDRPSRRRIKKGGLKVEQEKK
ncbi:MAG: diadenylate cyclase CdaA [Eubacterium sp.]|nr:diadenylate cyclase CdaA [Eubacterium sp.]